MPKIASVYLCLFLFVSPLCMCQSSRPAWAEDEATQEHQALYSSDYVPLKRGGKACGQPIVQVKLQDSQPAACLMDTGTGFSILSSEMAKQLNTELKPAFQDDGKPFLWKGKQGVMTWLSDIKINKLSILNVPFRILEDQDFMLLTGAHDDTHYDGIVGVNVLEHFAILLDASQHQFGVCIPGNLSLHQVSLLGLTQPYTVPITQKDDTWFVEAQFIHNGVSGSEDLELDTGSNITKVSDTLAQTLHLKISSKGQMIGIYNPNRAFGTSNVDTLQIGNLTLQGTTVHVAPITVHEPPLLGLDILSGYRVLIDFPAKKMYLQPNTAVVPSITVAPQTPPVGQTQTPPSQPQ